MILILAWLAILFTTLGIVAGDFFSVNLSTIARALHMSDNLAGVTFLALGNGSPDIFSTFAAMNSNSSSMAIGELVGAAAFITSVVAGSMALVKPFHVVKASLIRDCLFLIIAVIFLICVMVDGYLRLWHCTVMLVFYIAYVSFVMSWHWWLSRRVKTKNGSGIGITEGDNIIHPPSTEQTSLLNGSSNYEQARLKGKPGFWEDWSDGPDHRIDHRTISPSISSTFAFRHHEFLKHQHDVREYPGSSHNGHSQMVLEQQPTQSIEDHKSNAFNHYSKIRHVARILFPDLPNLNEASVIHRIIGIPIAMISLIVKLTVPVADESSKDDQGTDGDHNISQTPEHWDRWLLILQGFIAPQFMSAIIWYQLSEDPSKLSLQAMACLGGSILFACIILLTSNSTRRPRWYPFISIAGFIISVAWISTVADEMVSVLKALGVSCNISEAVLGLTVFAVGNSLDDLVANISVAQHRHPVMALSACFGGPLLNILLGISISGLYMFAKGVKMEHSMVGIDLHVNQTLFITAGTVIAINVATLGMMLWAQWRMTRVVGLVLIAIWIIGTAANLVLEVLT